MPPFGLVGDWLPPPPPTQSLFFPSFPPPLWVERVTVPCFPAIFSPSPFWISSFSPPCFAAGKCTLPPLRVSFPSSSSRHLCCPSLFVHSSGTGSCYIAPTRFFPSAEFSDSSFSRKAPSRSFPRRDSLTFLFSPLDSSPLPRVVSSLYFMDILMCLLSFLEHSSARFFFHLSFQTSPA